MTPSISVIIPFYSGKHWLKEALMSVFSQSRLPDEVILVNDGSEEDISDIVETYADRLTILYQSNCGAAAARNAGIHAARCDYVAFLDSDDLWKPKKIELQVQAIIQSGCKWSYTAYNRFVDGVSPLDSHTDICLELDEVELFPGLLCSCPIATPTVLVERNALLQTGLFNSTLRYGEDYCLWIELAAKYKVAYVKNELAFVRMHGNNASRKASIQLEARKNIWCFINAKKVSLFVDDIPQKLIVPYLLSVKANKVLEILCNSVKAPAIHEITAKVLYLFPWCFFKVLGCGFNKDLKATRRRI